MTLKILACGVLLSALSCGNSPTQPKASEDTNSPAAVYAPPVPNDNHLIPLSDQGNVAYQGDSFALSGNNTITVPSGTYHFKDFGISGNAHVTVSGPASFHINRDFSVTGNATLLLTSATEIYIDDDFDLSGNGIVNQSMTPNNLKIFMTGALASNDNCRLSGNAVLYAAVFAPNADVDYTGNSDLYGFVVGREIDITGNGSIHYDEALKEDEDFRWLTRKGTRLTA